MINETDSGKLTNAEGVGYDGDWKANMKSGKGTQTYASGTVYTGDFR